MIAITDNQIKVENAPQIAGLAFRSYHGLADCAIIAEILNASNKADQIEEYRSVTDIENMYKVLQRTDPARDVIFVEINDAPVGFGRCKWDQEPDGKYLYTFYIYLKPEGRLPGLCEALTGYFITRLREISQTHPAEASKYLQTWASTNQTWYTDTIEKLAFEAIRYEFEMSRPCSMPIELLPLPEGIEVRQPTPAQYRQVWEAQEEAFQDHWGYVEPTEKDYQWWLNFPHFDQALWKVAWDGDQVVGMVLNFIAHDENEAMNRKRGYTEFISVRRPWRRKGIARALLTQSIKMFQEMGMDETALGVDTENPNGALRLYEGVGYKEYLRTMIYRKPLRS